MKSPGNRFLGELSNPRLKLPLNCPTLHKLSDNPFGVFFILYMIFFSKAKSFIVHLMFKLAYYNSKYVDLQLMLILLQMY
ncbi:hypothetical protein FG05_35069 [Fusarium graminearum]|nr:hypothetical protein FG05_35069 [Fusarium graminearum]